MCPTGPGMTDPWDLVARCLVIEAAGLGGSEPNAVSEMKEPQMLSSTGSERESLVAKPWPLITFPKEPAVAIADATLEPSWEEPWTAVVLDGWRSPALLVSEGKAVTCSSALRLFSEDGVGS